MEAKTMAVNHDNRGGYLEMHTIYLLRTDTSELFGSHIEKKIFCIEPGFSLTYQRFKLDEMGTFRKRFGPGKHVTLEETFSFVKIGYHVTLIFASFDKNLHMIVCGSFRDVYRNTLLLSNLSLIIVFTFFFGYQFALKSLFIQHHRWPFVAKFLQSFALAVSIVFDFLLILVFN